MFRDVYLVFQSLACNFERVQSYKDELSAFNQRWEYVNYYGLHTSLDTTELDRLEAITRDRLGGFNAAIERIDLKAEQLLRTAGVLSFGSTALLNWKEASLSVAPTLFAASLIALFASGGLCLLAITPRQRPTEPTATVEVCRTEEYGVDKSKYMTIIGRDCVMEALSIVSQWKAASVRLAYLAFLLGIFLLFLSVITGPSLAWGWFWSQ
jgi:hypothetical protein